MNVNESVKEEDLKALLQGFLAHKSRTLRECISCEALFDYHNHKLTADRESAVAEHLVFCRECREFALALKFTMDLEPVGMNQTPNGHLDLSSSKEQIRWRILGKRNLKQVIFDLGILLWGIRKVAVLSSLVLVSISFVWFLCQPKPSRLALIELDQPESIQVRNASSVAFSEGLRALKRRHFQEARESFGAMLKDRENAYDAHSYLGLSYLLEAQHNVLGLRWVDLARVDKGLEYLKQAAELSLTRVNQTDLAECQLFLGKAYLMKGDKTQAISHLQSIEKLDQSSVELIKIKRQARNLIVSLAPHR